jgi:hypothetical protein
MKRSFIRASMASGLAVAILVIDAGAWVQPRQVSPTGPTVDQLQIAARQNLGIKAQSSRISGRRRHKAGKAFLAGTRTIEKGDTRSVEKRFVLAHELDATNRRYPLSAEAAQQYVITPLAQHAQIEWTAGRKEDALAALRCDPESSMVANDIATLAPEASFKLPVPHTEHRGAAEPIVLVPQTVRHSFHLRTDKRTLILQVLDTFGIRATIDQSVNAQRIHFNTDDIDFTEASKLLELATNTFFVPLDAKNVIAVANTKQNHVKFQPLVMRTFYLPGLDQTDLLDMVNIARNVFGAEQAVAEPSNGTLVVRAPEQELNVLEQTYSELLVGRSEVQLEVRLYEIDKTKATKIGVILPASATLFNVPSEINSILQNNSSLVNQLLQEDPSLAGNDEAILAALIASGALTGTVFNSPFALFGGGLTETGLDLGGVSVNMLLNSSDARSFDQQVVRVLDQEDATIRSGERYPIMTSSYSGLAGSSSSNDIIPQIQYEDLGLTLKVTPHVEFSGEVSLSLDMKLASLAGTSLNNIPILANREYSGVVSMRLGDSAILVSDLSKQESLEVTGVPGLSDLPGFSGTTNRQDMKDLMELAIEITPHLVRSAHQETDGPTLLVSHR